MDVPTIFALIFRIGMIFVYLYITKYFFGGYKKSKDAGYPNKYYQGFAMLFIILIIFHLIYGTYELLYAFHVEMYDFKTNFPWYYNTGTYLDEWRNQLRPLYLIFYFIMDGVIATQVYPLEQILGWKKSPFSKTIFGLGALVWLLFIPAIGMSVLTPIIVIGAFSGLALGFFLNIGANLKIFKQSTGTLRAQSAYAIFAFLLLAIGLVWSLEVNWISIFEELFNTSISLRWEVVIGSVLQLLAVVCYRVGFRINETWA
jgi:hypothetical protein